ncbi:MAG: PDZ domain-containing protein, partial [Cytophagales bacterium]|nr:PDZ domain-containing protein [Cytophagales bacterium]
MTLGASLNESGGKLMVRRVIRDTGAYAGALNVNDEILAIDQFRASKGILNNILHTKSAGDKITLTIARDSIVKKLEITLKPNASVNLQFEKISRPTKRQKKLFNFWLRGNSSNS